MPVASNRPDCCIGNSTETELAAAAGHTEPGYSLADKAAGMHSQYIAGE